VAARDAKETARVSHSVRPTKMRVVEIDQGGGQAERRWFTGESFDFIVWYSTDGVMVGFQICYREHSQERALTWLREAGFSHMRVDDGEGRSGKYKMTPTLVPDGTFDKETVLRLLSEASGAIDPSIVKSVCTIIQRYPSG
jgi:hypothetical protein